MAKTIENQVEDPNEEVVSLVHDIAAGQQREVRVKRVEVWRSLLGLDKNVGVGQVQAAWQARRAEDTAEADRQNRRDAALRGAAARLRDFDADAFVDKLAGVLDETTREALAEFAFLLADLRTVLRAIRE